MFIQEGGREGQGQWRALIALVEGMQCCFQGVTSNDASWRRRAACVTPAAAGLQYAQERGREGQLMRADDVYAVNEVYIGGMQ